MSLGSAKLQACRGLISRFAVLIALLGGPSHALAEEVLVPAAGTVATIRLTGKLFRPGGQMPVETEQTLTRTTVESDGLTATFQITYSDRRSNVPEFFDNQPELVSFTNTFRYFILTSVRGVQRDRISGQLSSFSSDTTCANVILQSFFPIGRVASVTSPCTRTSRANEADLPPHTSDLTVSYEGRSRIKFQSNEVWVQQIRLTMRSDGIVESDTLLFLDDRTGIIMRYESEGRNKDGGVTSTSQMQVLSIGDK